ncbi:hypothetical protein [Butyrivibrio sp. WCD2001]|uniref:hypothetical protein n=1 Tax=Butyrivibrio sp. WCD2001 TaxID=1280681 RepID=UPI0003FD207A|nr:hypothetical protein [Butyrivibrio sp. WCD2001]
MWKGLPKELVSIPIDYVEKAVKWLKEEKGINKIAMTSASTGAGYTLLAAKDDDAWPSDEAVPRMIKVLRDADYQYRVEWRIYDKASHALTDGFDEWGNRSC